MRVRESLLAQIWGRQLIKKDALLSSDGERIQVLYPGRENNDSGPDFCDAIIAIGGEVPQKGDVELHVHSHEWRGHGHHRDPSYNGVILHVVMWDDKGGDSLLYSGERVPILALHCYLTGSLEELYQAVQISPQSGEPCQEALERFGMETLGGLVDEVGEERFYFKAEQFRKKLNAEEANQVLYEGLMRALGYSKNKEICEELARRLPLCALREFVRGDIRILQALMLGIAGLLPGQRCRRNGRCHFSDQDELDTRRLEQIWDSFNIEGGMDGSNWRFFRVRPENYPTRRIVGASYLLSRYRGEEMVGDILSLISHSSLKEVKRNLERGLMVRAGGYWANYFDFGFESTWNPSLIGRDRARGIVVDIILPFYFAWAEVSSQYWLRERAVELFRSYPRLGENWLTRYMEKWILSESRAKLVDSALRQQGLIHLYKTFCVERRCRECPIGIASST